MDQQPSFKEVSSYLAHPGRDAAKYSRLASVSWERFTVPELKNFLMLLRSFDPYVSLSGRKAELIERLVDCINQHKAPLADSRAELQNASNSAPVAAAPAVLKPAAAGTQQVSLFNQLRLRGYGDQLIPLGIAACGGHAAAKLQDVIRWMDAAAAARHASTGGAPTGVKPPSTKNPPPKAVSKGSVKTALPKASSLVRPPSQPNLTHVVSQLRQIGYSEKSICRMQKAFSGAQNFDWREVVAWMEEEEDSESDSDADSYSSEGLAPPPKRVKLSTVSGPRVLAPPAVPPVRQSGLYSELREAGFSEQQALDGIAACGGLLAARFDKVMLWIVTNIEAEEKADAESDLEDEDMQAVILLSEGERDVIERRKRDRESSLRHDCQTDVFAAEELRQSYLLFGLPGQLLAHVGGRAQQGGWGGSATGRTTSACDGIAAMLKFFDRHASGCRKRVLAEGTKRDCSCPALATALRESVLSLLLLEAKALKWYRGNCAAYVYYVADRLSAAVKAHPLVVVPSIFGAASSSSSSSSSSYSDGNISKLIELVNSEVDNLQSALYSIPESDLGIPGPPKQFEECFRRLGVSRSVLSGQPDLEHDGLEIIEP